MFALQNTRPTNATYGYDFRETSAASHAIVVQKVRKADFEDKNYSGTLRHAIQYALTDIMHMKLQRGSSAYTLILCCKNQALVPTCVARVPELRICCRSTQKH